MQWQWTAFVEILPLWLAPNMVTLIGFFFILANVALLEIYVPDLVGPVGYLSLQRSLVKYERRVLRYAGVEF